MNAVLSQVFDHNAELTQPMTGVCQLLRPLTRRIAQIAGQLRQDRQATGKGQRPPNGLPQQFRAQAGPAPRTDRAGHVFPPAGVVEGGGAGPAFDQQHPNNFPKR